MRLTARLCGLLAVLGCTCLSPMLQAQSNRLPPVRYQVNVAHESGLTVVVVDTSIGSAVLYLPQDLVAGEQFTGRFDPIRTPNSNLLAVEADGQRALNDLGPRVFVWRVPTPDQNGLATLTVFSGQGSGRAVLARVEIPVMDRVPVWPPLLGHTDDEFVVPDVAQSGAPFPIVGPFDGDANQTSFEIDGKPAEVLAQSRRRTFVRIPAGVIGQARYRFRHDQIERRGVTRALDVQTTTGADSSPLVGRKIDVRVRGLRGLTSAVSLAIDNQQPTQVVPSTPMLGGVGRRLVIRPRDVRTTDAWQWNGQITEVSPARPGVDLAATLSIPKTADEQVADIVEQRDRTPGIAQQSPSDTWPLFSQYTAASLPALVRLMPDPQLGWSAWEAVRAIDADAAAELVLDAVPSLIHSQQASSAMFLYARRAAAMPNVSYREKVRRTAVTLLTTGPSLWGNYSCCDIGPVAIQTIGLLGGADDIPLLLRLYDRQIESAAVEASLARLGSAPHIARIESVLAAPLPMPFKRADADRISQAIKKAEFSQRREFVPQLCRHLDTPGFAELDVILVSPCWDAERALMEILGLPLVADVRTYCQTN